MKRLKGLILKRDSGLTLVEVLASIVLLSIILILFLSLFLQFSNTSRKSEGIITATYIAQEEMESFYEMSRHIPVDELETHLLQLEDKEYMKNTTEADWDIYERQYNRKYSIKIRIKKKEEDNVNPNGERKGNLLRVVVEINDSSSSQPKAQMENLFEWKE